MNPYISAPKNLLYFSLFYSFTLDFEIYSKCGRISESKHIFHAVEHRRDLLRPLLNGVELLL